MTELIRLLPDVDLIRSIDALLPQTQCGKCGHPGCKPYAEGIAGGEAINKCPPGGDETIVQLAELLSVPVLTLDMQRGTAPAQVAFIREAECIGCTKCIQACPVDAILGASRLMHTVIIDECTGCDLCVAPCPGIVLKCIRCHWQRSRPSSAVWPLPPELQEARQRKRSHARMRFEARYARLHREQQKRLAERLARSQRVESARDVLPRSAVALARDDKPAGPDEALKKARIALAMSRAQLNKSLKAFGHPPIAEQAARLVELQREYEAAEQTLAALLPQPAQANSEEKLHP
ncbi:electron transport complex, RnfABCDGE type, B subunit [Pseudomonas syringae pv. japonica str. M301072]|uniref:Ion-translocating oxidoreductase complex subunit B n=1 Tax=Pseudomonas syringae pv. japonica str. M301072 TaxID=629262 RepID=F3FIG6_PSESX|nr:electron transport complex, RnfABCDGE type, B subunit [Pseudomonas syringae pv. japonica str. M301072]